MPNPLKGEVLLRLPDGREFTLVLDHEALIEAEALYRKPLQNLMADAMLGFVGACRALLYGALRAHHPNVSAVEATAMFLGEMEAVSVALAAAAEAAFPKSEGRDGGNPPRPQRGKTSGASGAKSASSRTSGTTKRRATPT